MSKKRKEDRAVDDLIQEVDMARQLEEAAKEHLANQERVDAEAREKKAMRIAEISVELDECVRKDTKESMDRYHELLHELRHL